MRKSKKFVLVLFLALAIAIGSGWAISNVQAINSAEEPLPDYQAFDTSPVEGWCTGEDVGTIRMVGAYLCNATTAQDEQGNLWDVSNMGLQEDDFLLLWIADSSTETTDDDVLVKVWKEAHE